MPGSKKTLTEKSGLSLNTIIVCGVPLFICIAFVIVSSGSQNYWETEAWGTSSPEARGIASEVLVDMLSRLAIYPSFPT